MIVLQEIFGVNSHIRSVADRYAQEGFLAVAPALFDRVVPGVELEYTDEGRQQGISLAGKLSPEAVLRDIEAAIVHARGAVRSGKVAVVGYCLGGSYAWLSATRLSPDAAVGYYGSKIAAAVGEEPRCPVILHFGRNDKGIPLEQVEKIQAARPGLPVYLYEAGHGFNRDGSPAFVGEAAGLAFSRTLELLRNTFQRPTRPNASPA